MQCRGIDSQFTEVLQPESVAAFDIADDPLAAGPHAQARGWRPVFSAPRPLAQCEAQAGRESLLSVPRSAASDSIPRECPEVAFLRDLNPNQSGRAGI